MPAARVEQIGAGFSSEQEEPVRVAGQIGAVSGEELSEFFADVGAGPGVERVEEELQAFLGLSPGCPEQPEGAGLEADPAR